MDYEKKYKEALSRAKAMLKVAANEKEAIDYVSTIFPELAESEDEKIRKALIDVLNKNLGNGIEKYGTTLNAALAWLEKQGQTFTKKDVDDAYLKGIEDTKREIEKQKSINDTDEEIVEAIKDTSVLDMVEPKFKVGDWVVNSYGDVWHIDSFDSKYYQTSNGDLYCHFRIENQNEMHLWTILDAKDGDVFAGKIDGDDYILIFKQIKDGWIETYGHYYNAVDKFCVPSQLFCRSYQGTFTPATKEQRDTLEKAMAEAGYEWNAEKKELNKLTQSVTKKSDKVWGDEDGKMYKVALSCIETLEDIKNGKNRYADVKEWLKSLKDRVQPQPKRRTKGLAIEVTEENNPYKD